jgi:hypothetical protein
MAPRLRSWHGVDETSIQAASVSWDFIEIAICIVTQAGELLFKLAFPAACEAPYSHSIINEPSKLLICNAPETTPQKFTVIFTVKVRSTSIGAGLRAIRPEATFRDLSTSIDSRDRPRRHRRASM